MNETLFSVIVIGIVIVFGIVRFLQKSAFSVETSCNTGQCLSSLFELKTDCENITYNLGEGVCHSPEICDSSNAPCVYTPGEGTSCPGDVDYTGIRGDGICTDKIVCPAFAQVYFELNSMGVYQQRVSWINGKSLRRNGPEIQPGKFNQGFKYACGLSDQAKTLAWPQQCVVGEFTKVGDIWYCM